MKRPNGFLAAFLVLMLVEPLVAKNQDSTLHQPNIIVFLADDMGWEDTSLPFYYPAGGKGKPAITFLNRRYHTPNMERLAKHGMMFTAAYAQSLDTPSRCSILTGMNAARHRVTNQITDRDKDSSIGNDRLAPPDWAMNGI